MQYEFEIGLLVSNYASFGVLAKVYAQRDLEQATIGAKHHIKSILRITPIDDTLRVVFTKIKGSKAIFSVTVTETKIG